MQLFYVWSSSSELIVHPPQPIQSSNTDSYLVTWETVRPERNESIFVIYFLGMVGDQRVIQPFKIHLKVASLHQPGEPDFILHLSDFSFRLEDGQTFSQTLWITNPLKSQSQITTVVEVGSNSKELTVKRPWDIKDKLAKDKENPSINFQQMSPSDYWKVESLEKKPIGEIVYTAAFEKSSERLLYSSYIKVKIKQNLQDTKSVLSKELVVPVRFYKRFATPISEEDTIDLGIITSHEVEHSYDLRVENRIGKPAVITRVSLEQYSVGISIRVATSYSHKIPLAVGSPSLLLLQLYARSKEDYSIGYAAGNIHIYYDVQGVENKASVQFRAAFFENLFSKEDQLAFELKKPAKETDSQVSVIEGVLQNRLGTDIVVNRLYLWHREYRRAIQNATSFIKYRTFAANETFKAFEVHYSYSEAFTSSDGLAIIHSLGTFASIHLRYFAGSLMCSSQPDPDSHSFDRCRDIEKVDFSYIAQNHKKVKTLSIYNPTMLSYIIKRVEFASNSGVVELTFESQSKHGMKSLVRRTSKSINTFVLIPKNDLVTLRIKVAPTVAGNFRENISIYTNHGEFSLAIVYKCIVGEILFTHSTVRFDVYYPAVSQEKWLIANNKFNVDVAVNYTWSHQPFIMTHLRNPVLKQNSKESFLTVILGYPNERSLVHKRPEFLSTAHPKYVTLSDLVSFQDQVKGWDRILREAKTEISGEVIVQTELLSDLKIEIKGSLRRAQFVQEDKINVGSIEEKRTQVINVTLHNPTDRAVSMRFYIADPKLIEVRSLTNRVLRILRKRYAKYSQELICISHTSIDEEDLKYYAVSLFGPISLSSAVATKEKTNKVCFNINSPQPEHERFFKSKSPFIFNVTRTSRKNLIKHNKDAIILRDVLRWSFRRPPQQTDTIFGLGFIEKLKLLHLKFKSLLTSRLNKPKNLLIEGNVRLQRSVNKKLLLTLAQRQAFFINPEYRNKKVVLAAQETVTLPILVCHGQSIGDTRASLLIKNDFSKLSIVPITAHVGKASMIVQKVIYTASEGTTTSVIQKKEEHHKMIFSVHSADLTQKLKDQKRAIYRKTVNRTFELKNTGSLRINVHRISIDKSNTCEFNYFKIVNCEPFSLEAGQSHKLEIVLTQPQYLQPDLKKEIYFVLDSKVLVFEFEVKAADSSTPNITEREFELSLISAFRFALFIFMVTFVIISIKYYKEAQSFVPVHVTDIEKSRFGQQLFYNNIFDQKALEASIKLQRLESEKNRLIKKGVRDLMLSQQNDINNTSNASVISVAAEPQKKDTQEPKPETELLPPHYHQDNNLHPAELDNKHQMNQKKKPKQHKKTTDPSKSGKAAAGRVLPEDKQYQGVDLPQYISTPDTNHQPPNQPEKKTLPPEPTAADLLDTNHRKQSKVDSGSVHHKQADGTKGDEKTKSNTGNILDGLHNSSNPNKSKDLPPKPADHNLQVSQEVKREATAADTHNIKAPDLSKNSSKSKTSKPGNTHSGPTIRKQSFQSDKDLKKQEEASQKHTQQSVKGKKRTDSLPNEDQGRIEDSRDPKESATESRKSISSMEAIPDILGEQNEPQASPTAPAPRPEGPSPLDHRSSPNPPANQQPEHRSDTLTKPKDPDPPATPKIEDTESDKPIPANPRQLPTHQLKDNKKPKDRKVEVYYQRVDKPADPSERIPSNQPQTPNPESKRQLEHPSLARRNEDPRDRGNPTSESESQSLGQDMKDKDNSERTPANPAAAGFTPTNKRLVDGRQPLQRLPIRSHHKNQPSGRSHTNTDDENLTPAHPNMSFERMIPFHDQNISEIREDNPDPNASHSSTLMLLREEQNDQPLKRPSSSEENSDASDAPVDPEKSHEKIRRLMKETEELPENEQINLSDNSRPPVRVVGAIGDRAKRAKAAQPAGRQSGLSLLGFRHSELPHQPAPSLQSRPVASRYEDEAQAQYALYRSGQFSQPFYKQPLYPAHLGNPAPARQDFGPYHNRHLYPQPPPQPYPERPGWQRPLPHIGPQINTPTGNYRMYVHQYGSYVPKDSLVPPQPPQYHYPPYPAPQFRYFEQPLPQNNLLLGLDSRSSSGQGYDEAEDLQLRGYAHAPDPAQNYRADYLSEEEMQLRSLSSNHHSDQHNALPGKYAGTQFKAPKNNPFTLTNLGGGQADPGNFSSGWKEQEVSQDEQSGFSASQSRPNNRLPSKAPPGLADIDHDADEAPIQRRTSKQSVEAPNKPSSQGAAPLQFKKTGANPRYNLF